MMDGFDFDDFSENDGENDLHLSYEAHERLRRGS